MNNLFKLNNNSGTVSVETPHDGTVILQQSAFESLVIQASKYAEEIYEQCPKSRGGPLPQDERGVWFPALPDENAAAKVVYWTAAHAEWARLNEK